MIRDYRGTILKGRLNPKAKDQVRKSPSQVDVEKYSSTMDKEYLLAGSSPSWIHSIIGFGLNGPPSAFRVREQTEGMLSTQLD